jgi:hypothetical protein
LKPVLDGVEIHGEHHRRNDAEVATQCTNERETEPVLGDNRQ